jgi:hypothetical protein
VSGDPVGAAYHGRPRRRRDIGPGSRNTTESRASRGRRAVAPELLQNARGRSRGGHNGAMVGGSGSAVTPGGHDRPPPGVSTFIHPNLTVHGQLREVLY